MKVMMKLWYNNKEILFPNSELIKKYKQILCIILYITYTNIVYYCALYAHRHSMTGLEQVYQEVSPVATCHGAVSHVSAQLTREQHSRWLLTSYVRFLSIVLP